MTIEGLRWFMISCWEGDSINTAGCRSCAYTSSTRYRESCSASGGGRSWKPFSFFIVWFINPTGLARVGVGSFIESRLNRSIFSKDFPEANEILAESLMSLADVRSLII